jgi:hypothetical protein
MRPDGRSGTTRLSACRRTSPLSALLALIVLFATLLVLVFTTGLAAAAAPVDTDNTPQTATALTLKETAEDDISGSQDVDWFYVDLEKQQKITVFLHMVGPGGGADMKVALSTAGSPEGIMWPAVEYQWDSDGSGKVIETFGPCRLYVELKARGGFQAYEITVSGEGGGGGGAFPDVAVSSPYYEAITKLATVGVVNGYTNGNFGPRDAVLRAQFAKMIAGAIGLPVTEGMVSPFGDLGADDPYDLYPHEYVAAAYNAGITVGTNTGQFSPWRDIILAQVVTMIVRAGEYEQVVALVPHWYQPPFADFGAPHYEYARKASFNSLLWQFPGTWHWYGAATREECAFLIWRLWLTMNPGGE